MKNFSLLFLFFISFLTKVTPAPRYLHLDERENLPENFHQDVENLVDASLQASRSKDLPDTIVFIWNSNEQPQNQEESSPSLNSEIVGSRRIGRRGRPRRHPEWEWFAAQRALRKEILGRKTDRKLRKNYRVLLPTPTAK